MSCNPTFANGSSLEAMPEVAHQGALVPLGQIVLRARQPIVEPQDRAPAQRLRDARGPRAQGAGSTRTHSHHPSGRWRRTDRGKSAASPRSRDAPPTRIRRAARISTPSSSTALACQRKRATGNASSTSFARMTPSNDSRGRPSSHCTRSKQVRQPFLQMLALPLAQVRADFENPVVLRQLTKALEPRQKIRRHAAAAGADFQDRNQRVNCRRTSAHCTATHAPNRRETSGAVVKSPPSPSFSRAAAVVAQARRIQRKIHESLEAEPAARRVDLGRQIDRAGARCVRAAPGIISRRHSSWGIVAAHGGHE